MTAMHLPDFSEIDRFSLSLLLALLLHGILLLLSFEFEQEPGLRQQKALEITLVHRPRPQERNETPDFLAQTSQLGSGQSELNKPPKTRPAMSAPEPMPEPQPQPVQEQAPAQPSPPPEAISQPSTKPQPPKDRAPRTQPKSGTGAAALLAARDQEIARLTAELDFKMEASAKQPRRKYVSASTQEYKYAAYLQAWRKKVEKVGTLNFPDEAKRKKLFGNLVLQVALKSDGSIERIQLRKSSGHKVLDDAAIRIVRLSAPFAPFPANIAAETDILEITRTWQFVSGQPLFKSN
jgi:protein TonB